MEISLLKRIPIGAGLGGGSADCAAVINAINQLYVLRMTEQEREAIGAELGADVPFCIVPGAAIARGKGELLERFVPQRILGLHLVKTRSSLVTKEVFATLDMSRSEVAQDWQEVAHTKAKKLKAFLLREKSWPNEEISATSDFLLDVLHNDFETVAKEMIPNIHDLRMALESISPVVAMTGSGPTMYSVDRVLSKEEIVKDSFVQPNSPFEACMEHFRKKYHPSYEQERGEKTETVDRQEERIASSEDPFRLKECEAMCSALIDLEIWLKVKTVREAEPMLDWSKGKQRRKDVN